MDEQKFDQIWLFIEKHLKQYIPIYFKNVLKVCGYNNEITIAAIEDDDIKYIENEVRNGNVTKYFANIEEEKVLEDCTTSSKDFAFTMGHKKWLMTIVDFVKKHLLENGPESFTMEYVLKKKSSNKEKNSLQINHLVAGKSSLNVRNVSNKQTRRPDCLLKLPNENQNEISIADLRIQHGILICKVIMSLINITPPMYAKHMDSINKKISNDLIIIEIKKNAVSKTEKGSVELSVEELRTASLIEAIICCPLCSQQIPVFFETNKANEILWNTSNFDLHLENIHLNQADYIESRNVRADKTTIVVEDKEPLKKISIHDGTLDSTSTVTSKAKSLMSPNYSKAKSLELNKSTENIYKKTESLSPVQIYEPTKICIKKQTGCRENHNITPNEKLRPAIVCYSDTSVEDEEQQHAQLHSEIVNGRILKEQNKNFEKSQQILNSYSVAKTTYPVEELHKHDQNNDLLIPETGQFVICSLSVKNCSLWPARAPIMKNFVGQIIMTKESADNRRGVENVEIQLLQKDEYSKRIFHYPLNMKSTQVPITKILKILQDPLKNRRGKYVFKDKSLLDYVF